MNSAHDRRLQNLTCIAYTRSPAIARKEQAQVLAELLASFRRWARDARIPYPLAGTRHAGA